MTNAGTSPVCAVIVHVADVKNALDWYSHAFPAARPKAITSHDGDFESLEHDGIRAEVVPADVKVVSGAAGGAVCWTVTNFNALLGHFLSPVRPCTPAPERSRTV